MACKIDDLADDLTADLDADLDTHSVNSIPLRLIRFIDGSGYLIRQINKVQNRLRHYQRV